MYTFDVYFQEGNDLDILRFIEVETSFRHGKGQKTKSVVQVVEVSVYYIYRI